MPSKLSPIWMIGANVSLVVTVMPLRSRVTLLAWIVMALPTMAPMLRVRTYVPGWLMLVTWKIGTRPSSARAVATPIATRNNPRITGFFIGVLLSCPSCHTDSRAPGGQAARRIDWRRLVSDSVAPGGGFLRMTGQRRAMQEGGWVVKKLMAHVMVNMSRVESTGREWRACRRAGRSLMAAAMLVAVSMPCVRAASYYLATDVPARLGGAEYTQAQILRSDGGLYSVAVDTDGAAFKAMARRPDGLWLITESAPDKINGVFYEPRDVFLTDAATTFSMYFDGNAAGVPDGAAIDAILLDGDGSLVLSFDVPVNLAGIEYGPADLVRYSGGRFSLFWNAGAAGVPAYANVVGADRDSLGRLVVTFDVPTTLGGVDYLPGQLVIWNGGTSFSVYSSDPAWPLSAQLRDFAFVPAAGAVPDGGSVAG